MFSTVGLILKIGDPRISDTFGSVARHLLGHGLEVLVDEESAEQIKTTGIERTDRETIARTCDLVIVIGGDGTFLSAARSLSASAARLVGINLGRLGFLADIYPSEIEDRLSEILSGRFEEDDRFLLEAKGFRENQRECFLAGLNEIVIQKRNAARLLEFQTFVDGRLLNSQRSDGFIICTPTGSTAYALSGGGPILHPGLDALGLVPICPHTLSSRPVVVRGNSTIELLLGHGQSAEAWLSADGQEGFPLEGGDRVLIQRRPEPLRLIHPPGHNHFAVLRAKLHWAREL